MRVFVTGGTGFVGRYVVRELVDRGHEVILGVRDPSKAKAIFGEGVEVAQVDFSRRESVRDALVVSRPEAIVHLIGILVEVKSRGITFGEVHYRFSVNLYDTAKELGISKILHMSALGTEDRAPSRYHQTKRWAERHLIESGLSYTIFRPSLILGPEQRLFWDMDRITRVVPVVVLPGWGDYRFQPVDVRDVAACFVRALEENVTGIYELCGTREVSFRKLLEDIFSFLNRKVLMVPMPKGVMYCMGKLAEALVEPPPFSSDQVLMMWKDNLCGLSEDAHPDGVRRILKRDPIPYGESIEWALEGYLSISSLE